MRAFTRGIGGLVFALVVLAGLPACTSSAVGSRHALYESIDSLAADSSVIVVGTVLEQHGDDGTTVSAIEVINTPANPQLGANIEAEHTAVEVGDVLEVRQDTGPVLTTGDEYLLFLTPNMLPGEAATQFFITGAVAGLYVRDGGEFRRVVMDSDDTLPETITIAGSEDR